MTFSKLYIVAVCLFGLCLASCGADTDSGLISSAYASTAKVTGEATLDECPNGGVLLEAGIDSNGNGELDPKEVNDTYPICHGENGTPGKDGEPCIAEAQKNGDFEVKCPGQESLTVATGANLDALKDELAALKKDIEALKANPLDGLTDEQLASLKGEKGNDGKDGEKGNDGKDGKDGEQGVAGKDGVGIVLATLNDKQELVITLSDGTKFTSDSIKGDQGEPGKDGQKGEKGDAGKQGEPGKNGQKGDAFKYTDFTAEQLAAFKGQKGDTGKQGEPGKNGQKGDAFKYTDFTAEQLAALKGQKGDAFQYTDFTAEQLAALTGEKGENGSDGAGVDDQTMTYLANLKTHLKVDATTNKDIPKVTFTGANVYVQDGTGSTACKDKDGKATNDACNALGNLIVGYNEDIDNNNKTTGSHNLVVGSEHNYTSFGGFLAGVDNVVSGPFSSVSGGILNEAAGNYSSVSGGRINKASGNFSSVSGGQENTASGDFSSVSAGQQNMASGDFSSVSGGTISKASGIASSVSGGSENKAEGVHCSVSGGYINKASGNYSSVSAGYKNMASGDFSSVSGGGQNTASDKESSLPAAGLSGADATYFSNLKTHLKVDVTTNKDIPKVTFTGANVYVQDGTGSTACKDKDGNETNDACNALGNLVVGYNENPAPEWYDDNITTGTHNLIVGIGNSYLSYGGFVAGYLNRTSGPWSSVSGGWKNEASGDRSSVSGGKENTAAGNYSSVSGGYQRSATAQQPYWWVGGVYVSTP